ncbi:valine--tRNA ligase [Patescibacteria group bacterium]|nr:valine--tRNA ligase [Patescibacteria group bacterium]MBU4162160.1 valine--tRNA ligase [Patescibacteria group bacterium]
MQKQYDFKKQELKWQKFWEKEGLYKFNPKKSGKIFSIDTDPPTLSGKMHIGHVSSYTHEDIIARYHRMKGENVFFPFGVDNNGLPTEKLVESINGVTLFEVGRKNFVQLCQKTISKILPEFVSGWKRIGASCDFSNIYSTISPEVQKISQQHFLELFKQNRIYQKESPTLFCPSCQTAIAQAELEDKEKQTIFNDIYFELENKKKIIISTTRPELLPSCVALFVHPQDKRYMDLVGKTVIVPLFKQKVKILQDNKVDREKGSGIVMCCTFGDTADLDWYFKHNLPLRISITKQGELNELAKEFKGFSVKSARKMIIEKLKEKGLLASQKTINHSVNVHERCGTEIEILPTKQWFIKYLDLKEQFLKQSDKLNWYPKYMKIRLDNWINGLRWDWCISRQRYFGIPIPAWHCKKCGKVITASINDLPVDPLHSNPTKKCSCGSNEFVPETDVLDTWATSSLSPQIALSLVKDKKTREKIFPMSLRPQAHDIINFWLFYTLARSYLHYKKLPWHDVFISGHVLDSKGEKMSKSKGNTIDPETILEEYGTDAVRYWASQAGMGDDFRFSEEEIRQGKRTATKIWNASRFALMHLTNYSLKSSDAKNLEDEDKWILTKLNTTVKDYVSKMDSYQYPRAKEIIDSFFWKDFCDNYLEIVKTRVYEPKNEETLKAAQFTIYIVVLGILKLYAPIMPFVTEEVYQDYFRKTEKTKSIHLTLLPNIEKQFNFPTVASDFETAVDAIAQIRKYKSENQLSMKAEIESVSIKVKNKTKIKKYLPLISKLMSVKAIKLV